PAARGKKKPAQGFEPGKKVKTWKASPQIFPTELSAEAEQVLIEHPDIADVACIGVPHPEMGEELKALAILKPAATVTAETLIAWCRDRLSHYKCPRSLDFVDDLGRNTMGKINKRKLRAPYWA
ncbi:MAG: hypothetical protein AAGI15_09800, partial [Pseudomonadota bacterium]